ncbi:MAG: hypothetical protein JSU66_17535 [Deltaproteobacteria bacterium]|nr:MAG: hypothetical protein JSU66_17535 [Deltaproteobacteria bacterium]
MTPPRPDAERRNGIGALSIGGARGFDVETPFGGYTPSGIGRERGRQDFEAHLETPGMAPPARRPQAPEPEAAG